MFFLNLTAAEFFGLFGVLGGLLATLYLLDRSKRRKVVSTLRFWTPGATAREQHSRKRVREPWSLVLQLVSLLLLLLAIAQLEWGTREHQGRDHVLLLDTSSAAGAGEADGAGTVLGREKTLAARYLASLPSRDRVMLVRTDALSLPATPFTSNREQLLSAARDSAPAFSALNIRGALSFAHQAQSGSGGQLGEVVYIGPGLIGEELIGEDETSATPGNLRIIPVPPVGENCGIRRIAVRRGDEESNSWAATVTLKNYGAKPRTIHLRTQFAGTVFAPRLLRLTPGQETAAPYTFVTNTAGLFTAAIEPHDALPADDGASLQLPRNAPLAVAVYTHRPDVLRPLLEANHHLAAKFFSPVAYGAKISADIVLLDQFAPPTAPTVPSLWIDPPNDSSPLPVKAVVNQAPIAAWHSENVLGEGLHAKETPIPRVTVFQTFEGDIAVGSVAAGPAVVAREHNGNRPKLAAIGFDPLTGPLRFEVTTPLLFANLLRWLSPEPFRTLDISAGRVGTASVTLDPGETSSHDTDRIQVRDETGSGIPFTIRNQSLELFATRPAIVRVLSAGRERVLSLTLPDVADVQWKPPSSAVMGLPSARSFGSSSVDLWQWLAVLGGLGLLVEWLLFGRVHSVKRFAPAPLRGNAPAVEPAREFVSQ